MILLFYICNMKRIFLLFFLSFVILSAGVVSTSCGNKKMNAVDKRLKKKAKKKGSTGCPIKDC